MSKAKTALRTTNMVFSGAEEFKYTAMLSKTTEEVIVIKWQL
jgi:hypothetical protein